MHVEALPDGRELVEHDDGRVEVRGESARPAERARAGYEPRRRRRAATVPDEPEARDGDLLDADQRADFERRGRFWVDTPQGPVELGGPVESLAHHPDDFPDEEWVLAGEGDWSELLVLLGVDPERFFSEAAVVDRRRRPR